MVASVIKLVAVTLALVQWQNEKQYSNEFDTVWEYDQKELLQSGTVVCMYMRHNMYQQRIWRSCIWLCTIQTTTLTSRWRSYLNHFGDHVQFWHPHWIHLVHVCFDNLFSLSQLIPLSHTCMNVYGCCLLTVCSVFFEPQTVVEPPSEVDIRAKTTCLCITTNMQYACHILPLHHCSCYGNQIQSIGRWRH